MNFQIPQLTGAFYNVTFPILLLCTTAIISLLMGVSKRCSGVRVLKILNTIAISSALLVAIINYQVSGSASEAFLSGGFLAGKLGFFGHGMILIISIVVYFLIGSSTLS